MLVVISNVGLTDGTLVRTTAVSAGLVAAVERAAMRAGFGPDGRYESLDRIDIVLAGDTFNWLVSSAWCNLVKPWHSGPAAREARALVARGAVAHGRRLVSAALHWLRRGIAVPAANDRGRPRLDRIVRVPARVIPLVGDRDPWLGEFADALARHGMACGECWSDGAVLVRHGHELDPAARPAAGHGRRWPTLAESVAVDLVSRFAWAALRESATPTAVRQLIRLLASCRVAEIPLRVAAWMATRPDAGAAADRLDVLWRSAVADWLTAARRCVPACEVEFESLSALADWFTGAFHRGECFAVPDAIRRIAAGPRAGEDTPRDNLVLGHAAATDEPSVRVCRRDGAWESLLPRERIDPVVTVAVGCHRDGGSRIVDAA